MQEIEIHGLELTIRQLDTLPEAIRRAKADFFEDAGEELLTDVQMRIGGFRVSGVQAAYVGSGKGYVAVRAMANANLVGRRGGPAYAAGYITNALEHGHVIADPHTGRNTGRRVVGKYMYRETERSEAARQVNEGIQRINRAIEAHLKGVGE